MTLLTSLISSFAPILYVSLARCVQWHRAYLCSLVLSPITSYTDQILSIHRTRTSAGFSLDIPFIMLTASILKIFYWPGARYDLALLIQAIIMIVVQVILLKVALDNRPSWRGEGPFTPTGGGRPWGFWRWKSQRPYVLIQSICQKSHASLHNSKESRANMCANE